MKINLLFIAFLLTCFSYSQQNTEVYLFDFNQNGNQFTISNPINISDNEGYDNQPSFLEDGEALLFSSTRYDQTDIVLYNISQHKKIWLTKTPGSEYSPIQTPDKNYITSILLEKDNRQLLWKYSLKKGTSKIAVLDLKIGYQAWYDKNTLVSFVLGETNTLQVTDFKNNTNTVIASNIGRSIHKIPHSNLISYISLTDDLPTIYAINPLTKEKAIIITAIQNSQDMCWTPDGTIIMGSGNELYKFNPKTDKGWVVFASIEPFHLTGITRLSVSPKNNIIALVVSGK